MGFVRKNLGIDITGGGVARQTKASGKRSAKAARKARHGIRDISRPFSDLGVQSAGMLGQFLQQDQAQLPQLQSADQIINNPFFQALQQQGTQQTLNERAALGLGGSGGTTDALTRQGLLLGNQFQQQDFQNQQQNFANQQNQQQNRFNQLFGTAQFGGNIGLQSALAQGNLRTGAANALNVGNSAQAQQQAALGSQALQAGGALFGDLGGFSGISSMFGGGGGGGQPAGSAFSTATNLTPQNILGGAF